MADCFRSGVELYQSLAPPQFKIKTALSPFNQTSRTGPSGNPHSTEGQVILCPLCQDSFPADLNVPKTAAKKPAPACSEVGAATGTTVCYNHTQQRC